MIDTHQHLIYPEQFTYAWTRDIPLLQGSFRLAEYGAASEGFGITGAIFMEVDVEEAQSTGEAEFFCSLASLPNSTILGVIAAGRPEFEGFEAYLDRITHPKLVGLRRVLHTQPDALSTSPLFRRNIAALGARGLTFDLCVLQRQLGLALDLARACPDTTLVLDHCGVPDIAGNGAPGSEGYQNWRAGIRALSLEPNVHCKISGPTVYAAPDQRNLEGLRPYVDGVLESFGPARCLWGGDWPVVNLGSGLAGWCELTASLLEHLPPAERENVLCKNAQAVYLKHSHP